MFMPSTICGVFRCDSENGGYECANTHMHTLLLGIVSRHKTSNNKISLNHLWIGDNSFDEISVSHTLHVIKRKRGNLQDVSHILVFCIDSEYSGRLYSLSLRVKRTLWKLLNLLKAMNFQILSYEYSNSATFIKSLPTVITHILHIGCYYYCIVSFQRLLRGTSPLELTVMSLRSGFKFQTVVLSVLCVTF
jgi:hypothetical protein